MLKQLSFLLLTAALMMSGVQPINAQKPSSSEITALKINPQNVQTLMSAQVKGVFTLNQKGELRPEEGYIIEESKDGNNFLIFPKTQANRASTTTQASKIKLPGGVTLTCNGCDGGCNVVKLDKRNYSCSGSCKGGCFAVVNVPRKIASGITDRAGSTDGR